MSAISDKAFYKKKINRLINDELSEGVTSSRDIVTH